MQDAKRVRGAPFSLGSSLNHPCLQHKEERKHVNQNLETGVGGHRAVVRSGRITTICAQKPSVSVQPAFCWVEAPLGFYLPACLAAGSHYLSAFFTEIRFRLQKYQEIGFQLLGVLSGRFAISKSRLSFSLFSMFREGMGDTCDNLQWESLE